MKQMAALDRLVKTVTDYLLRTITFSFDRGYSFKNRAERTAGEDVFKSFIYKYAVSSRVLFLI